ncbi:PVC-type heme-binding CxxCH protein [Planctomicrobium sp. SH668]|uniref:PVC-type heme-binding CxxCH protein n=1 Tax=Planctomicrobium sp. SH668 TaxID=3448126 RepID=UPI003F5BF823
MKHRLTCLTLGMGCLFPSLLFAADQIDIPRRHDRPPNASYSAEEAAARMTVPEGFSVEVVASEPDLKNPVGMCIDEKGRFWVTESFEYPRQSPGPGRDTIKTLEDTDGDGKVDKVTVFAEGLNIPSGIAVGYGGVWVVNAPDLLFLEDTDGDGKADRSTVLLTGFGRTDTHELPNSLTWGPDGYLYGLNGVFNYCSVKYGEANPNYTPEHPGWDFTCALFRIHPKKKTFEIFAEGTSNPWGIAVNAEGEFFLSACVIDHLWHIVETGYYIRQGGPYPPHTWPMRSIVDHKHQKAAFCGIVWFDSDAYPPEYSNVLYMGNIHGACLNADIVERNGSTYKGRPHPGFTPKKDAWKNDEYGVIRKTGDESQPQLADLLSANDAWFMPVAQKVGPDGCLYVLDWYDRYHCYQDANADPEGVDRAKGRLYRIRYQDNPHAKPFDLNRKSDDELIALLSSKNVYFRETAQRLLGERSRPESLNQVIQLIKDSSQPEKYRLSAVYAAAAMGIDSAQIAELKKLNDPALNPWLVRLSATDVVGVETPDVPSRDELKQIAETSPSQFLQEVIRISKIQNPQLALESLLTALEASPENDVAIHQIIWENLNTRIHLDASAYLNLLVEHQAELENWGPILSRSLLVVCENRGIDGVLIGNAIAAILQNQEIPYGTRADCLWILRKAFDEGVLDQDRRVQILNAAKTSFDSQAGSLAEITAMVRTLAGDSAATETILSYLNDPKSGVGLKIDALRSLVAIQNAQAVDQFEVLIANPQVEPGSRIAILETMGRLASPRVADVMLNRFSNFEPDVQPKVIEILTQRPMWSLPLLRAIDSGKVDKSFVNLNQLIRLRSFKDEALQNLVSKHFGTVREGMKSDRQHLLNSMRDFLHGTPGDPEAGALAFKKVCAQCHKIYGEGADVGPDITRNGRNNWEQLLQNVFDPSAVIGPGYQSRMIATEDGRVLIGLPVEDSEEKVVLKIQGGKLETIPRNQIDEDKLSDLSLMPEDVEKLLTPQELADLFAFLALDRLPSDPEARILPGAPEQKRREK